MLCIMGRFVLPFDGILRIETVRVAEPELSDILDRDIVELDPKHKAKVLEIPEHSTRLLKKLFAIELYAMMLVLLDEIHNLAAMGLAGECGEVEVGLKILRAIELWSCSEHLL